MPVADRAADLAKAKSWQPTFDAYYQAHYPDYACHFRSDNADFQRSGLDVVLVTRYGKIVGLDEKVGSGYPDHIFVETMTNVQKEGFGGVGWFYTSVADEFVVGKVKGDCLDVYVLDHQRLGLYIRTHRRYGATKCPNDFTYLKGTPEQYTIYTDGVLVPISALRHFGRGPTHVPKYLPARGSSALTEPTRS